MVEADRCLLAVDVFDEAGEKEATVGGLGSWVELGLGKPFMAREGAMAVVQGVSVKWNHQQ